MSEPDEQSPESLAHRGAATPAVVRLGWGQARKMAGLLRLNPFDTSTESGRSLERYRRIALTTVSGIAVRVVGSLLGLISVPLVLSYLGKATYGLWATITTVVAWASLLDLGLANGLVNLLSAAHGRDDREAARRYLTTALAGLVIVATLLTIVLLLTVGTVPWGRLLGASGIADETTIRWAVAASLLLFIVSLPFSATVHIYAAYQRSYLWNGFALASGILSFGLLLLAVRLRVTLPLLIAISGVGGPLIAAVASYYAFRVAWPWLRPNLTSISKRALRPLLSLSVPIFLFQFGALVVNQTQTIMLAHRCDMVVVADYAIGMRIYMLVISVVQIGTNSFIPALRESYERGDFSWTRRAFARLLRVRLAIALAGGCAVMLAGNALLRLWLRRTDFAFGAEVWGAMALLMVVAMWGSSYAELLSIMDRLWLNLAAVVCNGSMVLVLTYWLSHRYQVFGALVALALPTLVVAVVLRVFGRRILARNRNNPA